MSVRSFLGVTKVSERRRPIPPAAARDHAARRPGIRESMATHPPIRPELLMYYWDGSAISQASTRCARASTARSGCGRRAGRVHSHAAPRPGDPCIFYEIDPPSSASRGDPYLFSFLWLCRPVPTVTLGDARLTLAEAPDGAYDLIVVDAFSSDAIPIHLLTREAMAMYKSKLTPHGMVVMHISNRHLELASVVAGIAAANGLITYIDDSTISTKPPIRTNISGTSPRWRAARRISGRSARSADGTPKVPEFSC